MKEFLFRRNRLMLGMVLFAVLVLLKPDISAAQGNELCPEDRLFPMIPKLTLQGASTSYERDIYPDGRIWLTPSSDTRKREILVPVFLDNGWYTQWDRIGGPQFIVPYIYSFNVSIMYDERALKAVGIETKVPEYQQETYDFCLADGWHIKWDDVEDDNYWRQIDEQKWAETNDNERGKRITITGASQVPLQVTSRISETYEPLFYIRFEVEAEFGAPGAPDLFNFSTPIYIDNTDVKYNDWNPKETAAWEVMERYGSNAVSIYGASGYHDNCMLAGYENGEPESLLEPVTMGGSIVRVFNGFPEFRLSYGALDLVEEDGREGFYKLPNPISVDSNSVNPVAIGYDVVQLRNNTTDTRLSNITIETDEPWLKVETIEVAANSQTPCTSPTRRCYIPYIDEGILGDEDDPRGNLTEDDGEVYVQIIADPTEIPAGEVKAGKYIGHVTFKSPNADVEPVRLEVEFYYYRNPYEPSFSKEVGQVGGIFLNMLNDKDEQLNLVFGTGVRATNGADSLFGEFAYDQPLSNTRFDARFFLNEDAAEAFEVPFGLGDITPNRYESDSRAVSRDIRDYYSEFNSYRYWVQFNTPSPEDYPIRIQWNTNDFPEGAQLFIQDTEDGNQFDAVNMRQGTDLGNGIRQFQINDPGIDDFYIEYTPARNTRLVDFDGNDIIEEGWNLLSLPARPLNNNYENVFPNAINIPLKWSTGIYQPEENLKVGYGYFVKYSTQIDNVIVGTPIVGVSLNEQPPNWDGPFVQDEVQLFRGSVNDPDNENAQGGWNLVGALSFPASIEDIEFDPFDADNFPDKQYTLNYGVWTYETRQGYVEVSTMEPGRGYWIKVDKNGYFEFLPEVPQTFFAQKVNGYNPYKDNKEVILDNSTKINILDADMKTKDLFVTDFADVEYFEMPPLPNVNIFDIRFTDDKYVTNSNESLISLQGVEYPINVRIEQADANYTLIDPVTEEVYGRIAAGESKTIKIENLPFNGLKLAKQTINNAGDLAVQVYPNPAVDNVNIELNNPAKTYLTIKLFDAIGNEVATIANREFAAGNTIETLNLTGLAAGTYMLRITGANYTETININVVK